MREAPPPPVAGHRAQRLLGEAGHGVGLAKLFLDPGGQQQRPAVDGRALQGGPERLERCPDVALVVVEQRQRGARVGRCRPRRVLPQQALGLARAAAA